MRVTRSILVNAKLDNYFRRFIVHRYGSLWGNYSLEVEHAMLVEMAWWRYTPFDEIGFLRRTEQRARQPLPRGLGSKRVNRIVKIDSVVDQTFRSFVLLATGRLWGSYSRCVESGMVLLMLLCRFRPFEEAVMGSGIAERVSGNNPGPAGL